MMWIANAMETAVAQEKTVMEHGYENQKAWVIAPVTVDPKSTSLVASIATEIPIKKKNQCNVV